MLLAADVPEDVFGPKTLLLRFAQECFSGCHYGIGNVAHEHVVFTDWQQSANSGEPIKHCNPFETGDWLTFCQGFLVCVEMGKKREEERRREKTYCTWFILHDVLSEVSAHTQIAQTVAAMPQAARKQVVSRWLTFGDGIEVRIAIIFKRSFTCKAHLQLCLGTMQESTGWDKLNTDKFIISHSMSCQCSFLFYAFRAMIMNFLQSLCPKWHDRWRLRGGQTRKLGLCRATTCIRAVSWKRHQSQQRELNRSMYKPVVVLLVFCTFCAQDACSWAMIWAWICWCDLEGAIGAQGTGSEQS